MSKKFNIAKNINCLLKLIILYSLLIIAAITLLSDDVLAVRQFSLFDKKLTVMGYFKQRIGFGISGDEFDTKENFQSANYDLLVETKYEPHRNIDIFVSGMLSGDFAYDILNDDDDWKDKQFDQSYDEIAHDTDFRDLLQEAHITWNTQNLCLRLGKQIVVWGQTDGFRLMDQINPLDQRRGITDVEFENTVLPIWLLRAQYFFVPQTSWLQDLNFEFIFNPNADFQPNRNIIPGNKEAGIWAPHVNIPLGGPYPMDFAHLGSIDASIDEPDEWDDEGFEYGVRLRSIIWNTLISLNYFYGIDNDLAAIDLPQQPRTETSPWDGRLIFHPKQEGFYPLFRVLGGTLTRDLEWLYISALGGVSPVLRMEAFYGFSNTFSTTLPPGLDDFEQHDEIRYAIGFDWKIKIPFLNPRKYFTISPQFFHRYIRDYPSDYDLVSGQDQIEKHNYQHTLLISTNYFHNKLEPSIFWLKDYTTNSEFFRPEVKYIHSHEWEFTLGAILIDGKDDGLGLEPLKHKDHVYFTIDYKF